MNTELASAGKLASIKSTVILFVCLCKILHKHCFCFLSGVPRESGNNPYAKFWRDKQRVLWYFWYWLINSPVRHAEGGEFISFKVIATMLVDENNRFLISSLYLPEAHQVDPLSLVIPWVNPFLSKFICRNRYFPRKVSYYPWRWDSSVLIGF